MKKPPCILIDPRFILQGMIVEDSPHGWLLAHCRHGNCRPISTPGIVRRLAQVLGDPAFGLSAGDRNELLGEYLPRIELMTRPQAVRCARFVLSEDFISTYGESESEVLTPRQYRCLIGLDEEEE